MEIFIMAIAVTPVVIVSLEVMIATVWYIKQTLLEKLPK